MNTQNNDQNTQLNNNVVENTQNQSVVDLQDVTSKPILEVSTQTALVPATPQLISLGDDDASEPLINTSKFSSEELEEARQTAQALDWADTNALQLFGSEPQLELSSFLDTLLAGIKVKEAGPAGNMIIQLAKGIEHTKVKEFQTQMKNGKSLLARIPFIGRWFDYARIFFAKQSSFTNLIEDILKTANNREVVLIRRNNELDSMVEKNDYFINQMAKWIISAHMALDIGEKRFKLLKKKADESGDVQDRSLAQDFGESVTLFRTRIADMKTAYFRSMSYTPQIRLVQGAIKIERQNIQRSILNDLPALKQAIVSAAANWASIQAQAENQARTDAVREIENLNADLTHQAYTTAKQSQGRSLDDARHLANIAAKALATMQEGQRIEEENMEKMRKAEEILAGAKQNLNKEMAELQQRRLDMNEAEANRR